jgi:outer membrane receptor protein involved in Fe transport
VPSAELPSADRREPDHQLQPYARRVYWDAYLGYKISERGELYGKVNNIANLTPPPPGGGVNVTLYDVIGRMYYLGLRYHL